MAHHCYLCNQLTDDTEVWKPEYIPEGKHRDNKDDDEEAARVRSLIKRGLDPNDPEFL